MLGNMGRRMTAPTIHGGSLLDFFETLEQIRKVGSYSIAEIESRDEQLIGSLVQACGRKPAVIRLLRIWGITQMPLALDVLSRYQKLDPFLLSFWLKSNGRTVSVTSLQPFVVQSAEPDIQNLYDRSVKHIPRMKLGAQFSYGARCRITSIFFTVFAFSGTLLGYCGSIFGVENDRQLDFSSLLDLWSLFLASDFGSMDPRPERSSVLDFMRFAWDIICEEIVDEVEHLYRHVIKGRRPEMKKPPLLKLHEYVTCAELESVVPAICSRVIFKTALWQLVFWRKCGGGCLKQNESEAFSQIAERCFEKLLVVELGHVRTPILVRAGASKRPDMNRSFFDREAFLRMLTDESTPDVHLSYQSQVLKRTIHLPLVICPKKNIREGVDERLSETRPQKRLKVAKEEQRACVPESALSSQPYEAAVEPSSPPLPSSPLPSSPLPSPPLPSSPLPSSPFPSPSMPSPPLTPPSLSQCQTAHGAQERTHEPSSWKQFMQRFVVSLQNFFGVARDERNA